MLKKAIAMVVIGFMVGLSFGAFSGDSRASGLETVMDQRPVDTARQTVSNKPCPTIQEIAASRNRLAEGATTAEYSAARDAAGWLVRCRAQFEWVLSLMKQTPEGRAYLARIAAHVNERLRLECGCAEGYAFVVIDQGGGPSYGGYWSEAGGVTRIEPINAVSAVAAALIAVTILESRGALSPAEARAVREAIALGGAVLGAVGPNALNNHRQAMYDWERWLSRESYYNRIQRETDGTSLGSIIGDFIRGGRDPER